MEALVLHLRRRWRNDDGLELRRVGRRCLAPTGQGALRSAEATLFAPVGQRRCCVARLILAGLRGKACCGAVCLSGRAGRRAGRRGKTALLIRAHPSRAGRRARSTGGASRAAKTARSSRGRLVFATIPRGERRALPAPAQGTSPLGIPFWGTGPSPPSPRLPKTPQAASPCSWTCRRLYPHRPTRNAKKHPCPLLVGHGCVASEPTALAAGTAGPPSSPVFCSAR